jgi:hypothetical protein
LRGRREHAASRHHLEEKLVNLDVPAGLGEALPPGIEAVAGE